MDSKVDFIFLLYTQNTSTLCQLLIICHLLIALQIVWNQIRPNDTPFMLWILNVCHADGVQNVFKILIHVVKKNLKFHYAKKTVNSFACKRQMFDLLIHVASQTVWTQIRPDKTAGPIWFKNVSDTRIVKSLYNSTSK